MIKNQDHFINSEKIYPPVIIMECQEIFPYSTGKSTVISPSNISVLTDDPNIFTIQITKTDDSEI
jgi:hypothetical protein